MILYCPHCGASCSLTGMGVARALPCPRCKQMIPAGVVAAAAGSSASAARPAQQSGTTASAARPEPPASTPSRTAAWSASPTDTAKPISSSAASPPSKPASGAIRKQTGLSRPPSSGRSQVPVPLTQALCPPAPRWQRRLITFACLGLSVLVLASSGGAAVWKLRRGTNASASAARADNSGETPAVQPEATAKEDRPPVAGGSEDVYGGIEIGSKDVKLIVVRLREPGGQGPPSELAAPVQTAATTLVARVRETGILDPNALRDTVRVVAKFQERLKQEHHLPPERIYVLASSGLFASIQDRPEQIDANKRHLADAIQKATGRQTTFISREQDLELTFRASVPPDQAGEALLVDLSTGKTSIGYTEESHTRFVSLSYPFGSQPLADEGARRVQDQGGSFGEQVDAILKDGEKMGPWREGLQRHPGLVNLKRIYLTGGPAWVLATIAHPQERGPHVALSFADVEAFARRLEECPPGSIPEPSWSGARDEAVVHEVEAAMRDIRKKFRREQLLAGMKILLAVGADLGMKASADKNLLFARDGYLGPALGQAVLLKQKTP